MKTYMITQDQMDRLHGAAHGGAMLGGDAAYNGCLKVEAILAEIGGMKLTAEQIKHMVDRFLSWKLPANFNPDCGISFKANYNEHTAHPSKHEPSGTNLFDARQAEEMVRYLISGLPRS